jgi:hypothetical protein
MPEFKIDRIRFRWRDAWTATTVYAKDDVIRLGGKVFVCIIAHTASATFNADYDIATPKWSEMLDGQSWTGDWQPSRYYAVNELVKRGGNVWICTQGHTANASAANGLIGDEAKWNVFAQGDNWRAAWQINTSYSVGDLVDYGGKLYRCITAHTSAGVLAGLEQDDAKWSVYTRNLEFVLDWTSNTRYRTDELVRYGGIVYRCTEGHQSSLTNTFVNPTNNQITVAGSGINFTVFRNGLDYYINVNDPGVDYVSGDTITVAGNNVGGISPENDIFITIQEVETDGAVLDIDWGGIAQPYQDGLEADQEKWQSVIEGIEYRGNYSQYTRYRKNDVVRYGGSSLWICTDEFDDSTLPQPGDSTYIGLGAFAISSVMDELKFNIWLPGLGFEAVWTATTYYQPGDVVMYGGYSYACLISNIDIAPAVTSITWQLIATGYNFRGDWIDADPTDSSSTPSFFKTGDVVRSGGNLFIAVQDNLDVIPLETSAYDPGTDSPQPWQLLLTGKRWRGIWTEIDSNTLTVNKYYPGDVVTVAGTTFACVEYHLADISAAKPTLDLESEAVGPLWVKIAQGGTLNVLENVGDIKAMGNDSVTYKIPIGTVGETLQVFNNAPDWRTQDLSPKVFYVSVEGVDASNRGRTLNAAFRTVKYATEYVAADTVTRTPCTIFIKTGIYEEILPIRVSRDVALVGDELRCTIIRPAAGYEQSNMFLVNNGSGIRNMTLQGLSGTLGATNQYLTRRPSAGAFVSLDPGTGPSDSSVWITTKSCYVQNVSTFGDGCVGMKVDGTLHNGGNKSIVANDFTQIISDGIGYWCVGEGKSELVSVFTYYCHIGYLAEDGGRVRATNGNNSYGQYGSVAEGVNATEVPVTAQVENRSGQALVNTVYNDENQIFCFGYSHTGQDYTNATVSITGSGAGASASITYDNLRYASISEVRVVDPFDSGTTGGFGYTSIQGNARGGDTTTLLLANQYDPLYEKTVTGTTADPINTVTIQNTTGMLVGDQIIFEGTLFGGILNDTVYFVTQLVSSNTIRVSLTKNGASPALSTATGAAYFVAAEIVGQRIQILEGTGRGQYGVISYYDHPIKGIEVEREFDSLSGWQHLLGGLAIEPTLDESTKYIIEPRVIFSDPTFIVNTVTLPISATWTAVATGRLNGLDVTTIFSSSGAYYSNDGNAWTACTGVSAVNYLYTARSSTYLLAVAANTISRSTNGAAWSNVTAPIGFGTFTSVAHEQNVFIITTNQGYVLRSTDQGTSWSALSVASYDGSTPALTHSAGGSGLFIVCDTLGQSYESVNLGQTFTVGADIGSTGANVKNLVYGNNRFVAACYDNPFDISTTSNRFYYTLANQSTVADSTATVWQPSDVPPETEEYTVGYSQGVFVAITNLGDMAESTDGKHWKILGTTLSGIGTFNQIKGGSLNGPCFIPLDTSNTNQFSLVRYGARAQGRVKTIGSRINLIELIEPGSNYPSEDSSMDSTVPTITIVDNRNTVDAKFSFRVFNNAISQPTFTNRGTGFLNVSATISGDGFRDQFQTGKFIILKNLTRLPNPGDNVEFSNIPGVIYKLANFTQSGGAVPNITGTVRVVPSIAAFESPDHETAITIREKYSQIRLTGHDFLDIGTGGRDTTNYPEVYANGFTAGYEPQQFNEVVESGGGRVFYTSTDQDGNFRVGEQFKVEQSSGIVTLTADFFDLDGLTELALGGVVLGGSGAVITQFSRDGTMVANSDSIVPTQKAIVAYLTSRISGGGANINVSVLRAGAIRISLALVQELGGFSIQIPSPVNFIAPQGQLGVKGSMAALSYYFGGNRTS